MATLRTIGLLVIGLGCVAVVLSPGRRRAIAKKLAVTRHRASRRIADEDARTGTRALDTWEDEGGALGGAREALKAPPK
jgi:hypothetical protein